jgi:hypothetical protein
MVCSVAGDCGEGCPAHEHCHRCITDVIHQFEDADLIAHTPQDIAALVAEVERLRIVVDTYSRVTLDDEGEIQRLRAAIEAHRERLRLEARPADRELWAVME